MRTSPALFVAAFALIATVPLAAGEIDPPFAARMQGGTPGEMFPAIVMLKDQVDVSALDRDLIRIRPSEGPNVILRKTDIRYLHEAED